MKKKTINYQALLEKAAPFSYLDYLNTRVSAFLVYALQTLPLTPNIITVTSLLTTCIASITLLTGHKVSFALLVFFSYTLDNADGIWARTIGPKSKIGKFLDQYLDYIKDYIIDITFFIFYWNKSFNLFQSTYLPIILFLTFLSIKGLYYLIATFQIEDIRNFHTQKLRIFIYTPAEKYMVTWPLIPFFFPIFIIHYMLTFLGYLFVGVILFKRTITKYEQS